MRAKTQVNFRWRYQPINELDKVLLSFIKQHPVLSVTEIMLRALRSFWLPIAIAHSTKYNTTEKQQIVQSCVYTLLRQAEAASAEVGLQLLPNNIALSPHDSISENFTLLEMEANTQFNGNVSKSNLTASELAAAAGGGEFDDSGLLGW